MTTPVPTRLRSGAALSLLSFDGKQFTLESESAFAPGTPMALELSLGSGVGLELKSIGSVRRPDGMYVVKARAATITKQAQEALAAHFGA